ncbi:hypothetical protein BDR26DRAFT_932728 [Obelidium mucronatum]|nr:hypothetical protein BDR26DRAFT_932728 [Obelidium mucronatum]
METYIASIETKHANELINLAKIKVRNAKEELEILLGRDYGVETTVRTANHKSVMNLTGMQLDHLNENLTVAEVPATQNLFNVESTAAADKEHKALVLGIDNAHHQQPSEIAKAMFQLWTEKGHKIVQALGRSTTNSHKVVVSLYFETEQDKLRCMQLHPCLYFNRNTAILADKDKTPDFRCHREHTRTLVVKDVEKYTRAQDWDNVVRTLGNGKANFKISEDDAKKMDNTYGFPESNATFTFVRKLKPDGTYRNRDNCKHCRMDHLHQNCPTHKKEVEERLKRLGQRTFYLSMSGEEVGQIQGIRLTEAQAKGCRHLEIHMAEAINSHQTNNKNGEQHCRTPKCNQMALQGAPPTAGRAPTGRTFQTEEERKEELKTAVQAEVNELQKEMETKMEAEMERVKGELEETMLEPLDEEMGEEEEGETLGEAIIGEIKVLNKEIFGCNEGKEDEYVGLKKREKSAGVEYIKRHNGKGKKGEKKKRPETGRTNDESGELTEETAYLQARVNYAQQFGKDLVVIDQAKEATAANTHNTSDCVPSNNEANAFSLINTHSFLGAETRNSDQPEGAQTYGLEIEERTATAVGFREPTEVPEFVPGNSRNNTVAINTVVARNNEESINDQGNDVIIRSRRIPRKLRQRPSVSEYAVYLICAGTVVAEYNKTQLAANPNFRTTNFLRWEQENKTKYGETMYNVAQRGETEEHVQLWEHFQKEKERMNNDRHIEMTTAEVLRDKREIKEDIMELLQLLSWFYNTETGHSAESTCGNYAKAASVEMMK